MNWKKLGETYVYNGWRKILRKQFELPNGKVVDFDILSTGHYVTVAAVTEQNEFILVRQYRPGPERVLLSFPEGAVDKEEEPEEAARRELLEETGFAAGEIVLLKKFRSSYTNQIQYCLLATGCRPAAQPQPDEHEFLDVYTLPPADLRRLMRDAEEEAFNNVGCAYLAMEWLGWLEVAF